ncbi:hypothetical protein H5410_017138 [Solanum commersonii]|uniref:Uncharacterized protein n=1 Tax=Solanum commersonii TaxID=4109 RepID=A0A9J5ZZ70_SOLCO|nr:hypothetical protein H5410_017138 [Solanum commersonii]
MENKVKLNMCVFLWDLNTDILSLHVPRLSCAESSLLMPYPCQILSKYTTFGESNTHLLIFIRI